MRPDRPFPDSARAETYHPALESKLVGFSHLLRHRGFQVGIRETEDAFRVADYFLCSDFAAFQDGLRSLFCLSKADWAAFDNLFTGYWCAPDPASRIAPPRAAIRPRPPRETRGVDLVAGIGDVAQPDRQLRATSGASSLDLLRRLDFSQVGAADQDRLERLAARLWRRAYLRMPRRLRGSMWRNRIHFRRTIRRNMSHGGDPVHLVLSGKKPRRPRLVVMLDISGSMELYSFTFLRLLYVLQGRFRRVHSFVFSTTLEDVSRHLAAPTLERALAGLGRIRLGWNGGTRIGACLHELIEGHGMRIFRPDTVFIIFSDGLDTGEPEGLASALRAIRKRTRKVIWLNPLLGIEGYEPIARGMRAALPLVDVFAPAHNLDALLDLEKHLVG